MKELLVNLKTLVNSTNEYVGMTYANGAKKGIDGILEQVKNKHMTKEEDATITGYIRTLYTDLSADYKSQLNSLISSLYNLEATSQAESGLLTSLQTNYDSAISSLQSSKDAQVAEILTKLQEIETIRANDLVAINNVTSLQNYSNLKYYRDAIYTVWFSYCKKNLISTIEEPFECPPYSIILT